MKKIGKNIFNFLQSVRKKLIFSYSENLWNAVVYNNHNANSLAINSGKK